jgi:hypothetical protein
MRPERARALSCRGTRTVVELANDYAHTYAPFIRAAVREVGQTTARSRLTHPGAIQARRLSTGNLLPCARGIAVP